MFWKKQRLCRWLRPRAARQLADDAGLGQGFGPRAASDVFLCHIDFSSVVYPWPSEQAFTRPATDKKTISIDSQDFQKILLESYCAEDSHILPPTVQRSRHDDVPFQ